MLVERRVAEPILPLHLFRNRNFALISVIGFLLGFAMFGAMNFLPLFQQTVQGASATNSGLLLLPMMLGHDGRLAGRRPGHHQDRQVQDLPDRRRRGDDVGMSLLSMLDVDTSKLQLGALHGRCSASAWAS